MKEIAVRRACESDGDAIARLLRQVGWFGQVSAEPLADTARRVTHHIRLCRRDDSHTIWVAETLEGDLAGYVAVHWLPYLFLHGPEGYISELFVQEQCRGQGVGSRLLAAVREEARERGCSRLMLINSRTRDSYRRGFYAKQGWVEREGVANFILPLL